MCREQLRRTQRYIDTFLQAIHLAFTNVKKGSIDVLGVINHKKKLYAAYRSEEGFTELCKNLLLGDYLDDMGKPMQMFDGVWSDQKDLSREAYFKAFEQYLDFCEKAIPLRSKQIIKRLMNVLEMDSPITKPEEIISLEISKDFETLEAMPDDPDGAISYAKNTSNAVCFVQLFPIESNECMPMNDLQPIIDGIHNSLADNQGIVEIANGKTKYDKQYVYSIVKSSREPHGMNYILTMHITKHGKALSILGHFEERGLTGKREAYVYEYARRENIVNEIGDKGWFEDPYDKEFTRGLRMNLSENRKFDRSFPDHPLSQMRTLIAFIIENN